jgi:hypothetical protein
LCSGGVSLDQAQSLFLEPDWTKEFLKHYHAE